MGKTTLYRYLKKKIKLRSISETLKIQSRKNFPINEIIRLYIEEKFSIKMLSEIFSISQNTIRKILLENNVILKDWGEINHLFRTTFTKPKVSLTENEKAYITGLVVGDFAVYQKSKYTLRITTASTISEFISMNREIFEKYGHVMQTFDKYNNSEKVTVDLDFESFKFLFDAKKNCRFLENTNEEQFFYFLAGFIDAEGSISIYRRKLRNCIEFSIQVYNTDLYILKIIKSKLEEFGFNPLLVKIRGKGKTYYKGKLFVHNYDEYRVSLGRKFEIQKLLKLIQLKHTGKMANKEMILYLLENKVTKINDFLKIEQNHPFTLPKAKNFTTGLEIPDK